MRISLTKKQIRDGIPKVEYGLGLYVPIQAKVAGLKAFHNDSEFRRNFNYFYRVRRNPAWRDEFYSLMACAKKEKLEFPTILRLLHDATGRFEASFASKLYATLNPSSPVIDSIVLKNCGLKLPSPKAKDRICETCAVYGELRRLFGEFLETDKGKYLVEEFRRNEQYRELRKQHPTVDVTDVKMLDLVLWQTRQ